MTRLFRILLNCTTLLSLAICIVTVVLWVRSYWRIDLLIHQPTRNSYDVYFDRGSCSLRWIQDSGWARDHWRLYHEVAPPAGDRKTFYSPPESTERRLGGFWYEYGSIATGPWRAGPLPYRVFIVPCWAVALLFLLFASVGCVSLYRAHRRRDERACLSCGYDLRATLDRCPECGTVPTAQPPRPGGAGG